MGTQQQGSKFGKRVSFGLATADSGELGATGRRNRSRTAKGHPEFGRTPWVYGPIHVPAMEYVRTLLDQEYGSNLRGMLTWDELTTTALEMTGMHPAELYAGHLHDLALQAEDRGSDGYYIGGQAGSATVGSIGVLLYSGALVVLLLSSLFVGLVVLVWSALVLVSIGLSRSVESARAVDPYADLPSRPVRVWSL
jgi:hypothetical protein